MQKTHNRIGIHHTIEAPSFLLLLHARATDVGVVTTHHGGTCLPSVGSLHTAQFWSYPKIDQLLHPQSGSRGLSTRAMTRRLRASIHVFASSFRLSIIWLAVAACYTGVPLLPEHPPSQSNYRTPTRAGKSDWATASGAADSAIVILLTARQVSA